VTARLRRSELSTPGSSERMIEKAAASAADLVFLDLEDSVAPSAKEAARATAIAGLCELDWGAKTRAVRINAADTEWAYEDLIEVVKGAGDRLDLLILPKVKSPRDVWWVETVLDQMEMRLGRSQPVKLEVLIEEVEALINVEEIARCSPRIEALIFGPGDFSASQGVKSHAIGGVSEYPGDVWHYARNKIVVAARAARLEAVDGPYADFHDEDGYERECERSSVLGFTGKWAIHPSQIPIANEVYSPTAEEESRARRVMDAYDEAMARGLGAVTVDGRMIDAASVRILRNVVEKADLIQARKAGC
jgi:citrate lyase subunit beta/citryl-CoA lyase